MRLRDDRLRARRGTCASIGSVEVGGLILFVKDGMLQSLEIYSRGEPLPLPQLEQVTWQA